MSPEYQSFGEVPHDLQRKIRSVVGKKSLQRYYDEGLCVLVDSNGEIKRVIPLNEAFDGVIKDAKRERSPWYLVHGLKGTHKKPLEIDNVTLDRAERRKGQRVKVRESSQKPRGEQMYILRALQKLTKKD